MHRQDRYNKPRHFVAVAAEPATPFPQEAGIQKSTDGKLKWDGKSNMLSVRLDTRFRAGMAASRVRSGAADFAASNDTPPSP